MSLTNNFINACKQILQEQIDKTAENLEEVETESEREDV